MVRQIAIVALSSLIFTAAHAQIVVFNENNDGATDQLIPSVGSGPGGWAIQTNSTVAHSGNKYWMSDDPAQVSDYYLTTPTLNYTSGYSGPVTLSFWHEFNFESGFDGGAVELSRNGGAFADIGSFTQNGYNGTIDPNTGNPIAGRSAFTGTSPGFTTTANTGWMNSIASIGGLSAGDTFRVRFRSTSDVSVSSVGWLVDDVKMTVAPVPEPASLAILGIGALALLRRRSRR
jgi:hypothetical protein